MQQQSRSFNIWPRLLRMLVWERLPVHKLHWRCFSCYSYMLSGYTSRNSDKNWFWIWIRIFLNVKFDLARSYENAMRRWNEPVLDLEKPAADFVKRKKLVHSSRYSNDINIHLLSNYHEFYSSSYTLQAFASYSRPCWPQLDTDMIIIELVAEQFYTEYY